MSTRRARLLPALVMPPRGPARRSNFQDQAEIGHQLTGAVEAAQSPISATKVTAVKKATPRSAW